MRGFTPAPQQGYYPCTHTPEIAICITQAISRWCVGNDGGALPLPTPQGALPLDPVPNLQSSFCRQCAGVTRQHAQTCSQKNNRSFANWLRHRRPRRNLFEKSQLLLCELAARTAGHGLGGVKHRRPDAFASGENNRKRPEEKASFLSRLFLCFHCARGPSCRMRTFLRSPTNMRKTDGVSRFRHRRMGAGPMALP